MALSDRQGLQAIASLIEGTGRFARVDLSDHLPRAIAPEDLPLCWIQPGAGKQTSRRSADHPQTPDRIRVVEFRANLLGPEGDEPGYAPPGYLGTLEEAVIAAVDGQGLGGAVAALTRIERSEPVKGRGLRLFGSFTLLPDL